MTVLQIDFKVKLVHLHWFALVSGCKGLPLEEWLQVKNY